MKVLIHYTMQEVVFNAFKINECTIEQNSYRERYNQIDKYYKRNYLSQDSLFFIVQYYNSNFNIKYVVGKIVKNEDNSYKYIRTTEEIQELIITDLGLKLTNTYDKEIFYKEYCIESKDDFYSKEINQFSNKIKLKYFSWEELLPNNKILHSKLVDLLFDRDNVLNVASTYCPSKIPVVEQEKIIKRRYISSLRKIGFISNDEINIENTVLHGDIGEFLMDIMIGKFLESDNQNKYIFPKLAFKTRPKSAIHGYDGTFYNKEKNEIFYTEAKFYSELTIGLSEAVDSMNRHDRIDYDFIESNIDLFRNLANNETGDIIEISDDVKEILIIFIICSDKYTLKDVYETIDQSRKLKKLLEFHEIIIFVLPLLSKEDFLNLFRITSEKKRQTIKCQELVKK